MPHHRREAKLDLGNLPAEVPSDADMVLTDVSARVRGDAASPARTMKLRIYDEADAMTESPAIDVATTTWKFVTTSENIRSSTSARARRPTWTASGRVTRARPARRKASRLPRCGQT